MIIIGAAEAEGGQPVGQWWEEANQYGLVSEGSTHEVRLGITLQAEVVTSMAPGCSSSTWAWGVPRRTRTVPGARSNEEKLGPIVCNSKYRCYPQEEGIWHLPVLFAWRSRGSLGGHPQVHGSQSWI